MYLGSAPSYPLKSRLNERDSRVGAGDPTGGHWRRLESSRLAPTRIDLHGGGDDPMVTTESPNPSAMVDPDYVALEERHDGLRYARHYAAG